MDLQASLRESLLKFSRFIFCKLSIRRELCVALFWTSDDFQGCMFVVIFDINIQRLDFEMKNDLIRVRRPASLQGTLLFI